VLKEYFLEKCDTLRPNGIGKKETSSSRGSKVENQVSNIRKGHESREAIGARQLDCLTGEGQGSQALQHRAQKRNGEPPLSSDFRPEERRREMKVLQGGKRAKVK